MPLIAGYAHCYVESNSKVPVTDLLCARSAVARLHGEIGRDHPDAVFARGFRVFHRGDFSGLIFDGMETFAAPGALVLWRARNPWRSDVRHLRRDGQRVDEYA